MKSNLFHLFFALLLVGFMIQGFQCGSPDFTGAKVQEQNKNYAEAARLYEKEVQKNPANQDAWYYLGRLRGTQLNDLVGMNQAFNEANKISDKYAAEIHTYRVLSWGQRMNNGVSFAKHASGDSTQYYDKAIEEYNMAAVVMPDTALTYHYIALTFLSKVKIDTVPAHQDANIDFALAAQKKAWNLSYDAEQYKQIGGVLVERGLEKKEKFRIDNADQLKLQKNLKEIDKGSYETDVIKAFTDPDSKKKDPKNTKKEEWTYNKYEMTLTIENGKVVGKNVGKPYDFKIDSTQYNEALIEFNKAVDVFEAVKTKYPKDNQNLNMLLQAYYEANRSIEATKAFKLAVDNEPGNKMNHYILGLLYRSVEDYIGAIAEFNTAIKIDSNFTDAYYDIGATYYNWGVKMKKAAQENGDESEEYKTKFQEALPWIEKVANIRKDDAKTWETIGTIYAILGQADKATKALDEADKIRKAGK
jgi:tetratricopeptide (TPR) repeat protein